MDKQYHRETVRSGQIDPPGRRTGEGAASILPYLVKSLRTKPQVHVQPQDAEPGVDFPDSVPMRD